MILVHRSNPNVLIQRRRVSKPRPPFVQLFNDRPIQVRRQYIPAVSDFPGQYHVLCPLWWIRPPQTTSILG